MWTEQAKSFFEIHIAELSEWSCRPHKHNFFELVYIDQGSGFQCINTHEFPYEAGNIFLLPPLDCHSFDIRTPTRFFFVRFTDHYFLSNPSLTDYRPWFDKIAYILAHYNRVPGDIIKHAHTRQFIRHTLLFIHQEYLIHAQQANPIIAGAMASILSLLARNVEQKYVEKANACDGRFGDILRYIHTHIKTPERLRVTQLSSEFGIAPSYFSEYFKKQTGQSYSRYLMQTRLKLVETQIRHTELSIKEIAHQLNFTDSSHLTRVFKQHYGMTIKAFRQEVRAKLST